VRASRPADKFAHSLGSARASGAAHVRQISTTTSIFSRLTLLVTLAAMVLLASCQSGKIPDQGSYAAQLYVKRCGFCHQPYQPSLMTTEMWRTQVDLMQERMKQIGIAPLSRDERKTIIDYLSSHAGKQ